MLDRGGAAEGCDGNRAGSPARGEPLGIETRIALTTEDAEAELAELRARGVDADAKVMRMGGPVPPIFFFRDQDGNTFLIIENA